MASYDIFISYRRTDSRGEVSGTNIARSIKQQLEIYGYMNRVFFDYSDITDGEFEETILPAIEGCKVLLLILSREALQRCINEDDWVRREVIQAIRHNIKIVPINPDYLFDGYPQGFPEEMGIIKRIQHQCIHMDASFENDIRNMIEKRIAPVTRPQTNRFRLNINTVTDQKSRGDRKTVPNAAKNEQQSTLQKNKSRKGLLIAISSIFAIAIIAALSVYIFRPSDKDQPVRPNEEIPALAVEKTESAEEQYNAGLRYEKGDGVKQDYAEAARWYTKAAEQGHAEAQSSLAYCYSNGLGVEQNDSTSASWYLKAAMQGHATSQYNIGICYSNGLGVKQDHSEAAKWYRKVAEQGYATAQYILGACYENGLGIEKDIKEATKWYQKAADQGNTQAINALKQIKQR